MQIIDTHCHLDRFQRAGEFAAMRREALDAGVTRMITIGTKPEDWTLYRELSARHGEWLSYTVGLHPCDVDENWKEAVQQISTYFVPPDTPVALGETGLDHFHLPKDPVESAKLINHQEDAFRAQLEIALQLDCPVVIHSRGAFQECLRVIDESGIDWGRVVFHCFAEGADAIRALNERGGRGSFTGILTYKNAAEVREAAQAQGLDRLMLETDAPFLAPVPYRGKRNQPAYTREIAAFAAELFAVDLEDCARISTENAETFFGLNNG